jgi:hypothetical protein
MVRRTLKIAIVVVAAYALMKSPAEAARNVKLAGTAAFNVLVTVADRAGEFFDALVR